MFRAIKEYLKKIIPSKESYKQKVIANNKKNNGIIIGIIIILLIILMGMVIWCYMCKPKIYEYVGMIYLFLLLLVLFFYFITYLCSCEFNYYFFIAIMCLILIPLSPMYLLTIQYEKKFKLNVISIWDPVVFIALTLILAVITPILSIFIINNMRNIFNIPEYIYVCVILILLFVLKFIVIKKYINNCKKDELEKINSHAFIIACVFIVFEYIFFIYIYQIVLNDMLSNIILSNNLISTVLYYIDKFYLIYACVWLVDSIALKID